MKQEEEADTRILRKEYYENWNKETRGKSPKQDLISAQDLTSELPEGLESPPLPSTKYQTSSPRDDLTN